MSLSLLSQLPIGVKRAQSCKQVSTCSRMPVSKEPSVQKKNEKESQKENPSSYNKSLQLKVEVTNLILLVNSHASEERSSRQSSPLEEQTQTLLSPLAILKFFSATCNS